MLPELAKDLLFRAGFHPQELVYLTDRPDECLPPAIPIETFRRWEHEYFECAFAKYRDRAEDKPGLRKLLATAQCVSDAVALSDYVFSKALSGDFESISAVYTTMLSIPSIDAFDSFSGLLNRFLLWGETDLFDRYVREYASLSARTKNQLYEMTYSLVSFDACHKAGLFDLYAPFYSKEDERKLEQQKRQSSLWPFYCYFLGFVPEKNPSVVQAKLYLEKCNLDIEEKEQILLKLL